MGVRVKAMGQEVSSADHFGHPTVRRLVPPRDNLGLVDTYVRRHPDATPYHRSAWLEAVYEGYGHPVSLLAAFDDRNEIVGILPLCHLSVPGGRPGLVSQAYCDLGGPLADSPDVEEALVREAVYLAKDLRAKSLSFRRSGARLDDEQPESLSGRHKVSMLCKLPESSEALFKSYKPKLRSQIRKAEKNGLTGSVRHDEEALDVFYKVFAANMHRLGSPVHAWSWFRALHAHYGADMIVGVVSFQDVPVGAGIVLLNGQRASIPWASTLSEYNHLAPNMLLYWTLLSYVADRGINVFDFGRSSPGEGTYRFKKQWGAVPHALKWSNLLESELEATGNAEPSQAAKTLRSWVESLWRSLPLSVANRLGPLIRKYISL